MRNLKDASLLGFVVGMMAVPRILEADVSTDVAAGLLLAAVFPSMTLVAGAATAWGKSAGMAGLFPERRLMIKGVLVGLLAALLILPFKGYFDEQLRVALEAAGKTQILAMTFPATVSGCLAMIMWAAGFETMFFSAGTMSFLARISNRKWVALAGVVILRVAVSTMVGSGMDLYLRLASVGCVAAIGGLLYMRAGLPSAMTFIAVLDLRHLFRLLFD